MSVITRVYDSYDAAQSARHRVDALALPEVEVSILGNESLRQSHADRDASGLSTGAGIGAAVGGGAGLLAGLGMLAIPGVGPLVAAGWLAATAVGAAGGAAAGGAVGAMVDLGLSDEDAPVFSEAIRRGGVAASVRCHEPDRDAVEAALDQYGASSLSDRREAYDADGCDGADAEATRARVNGLTPVGLL